MKNERWVMDVSLPQDKYVLFLLFFFVRFWSSPLIVLFSSFFFVFVFRSLVWLILLGSRLEIASSNTVAGTEVAVGAAPKQKKRTRHKYNLERGNSR